VRFSFTRSQGIDCQEGLAGHDGNVGSKIKRAMTRPRIYRQLAGSRVLDDAERDTPSFSHAAQKTISSVQDSPLGAFLKASANKSRLPPLGVMATPSSKAPLMTVDYDFWVGLPEREYDGSYYSSAQEAPCALIAPNKPF